MSKRLHKKLNSRYIAIFIIFLFLSSGLFLVLFNDNSNNVDENPDYSAEKDFVYRDGKNFMLNGESFYYAGSNQYYMNFKPPVMIDDVFNDALSMNLKVLRVWGHLEAGILQPDGSFTNNADTTGHKDGVYFQYWDPVTNAPAFNDGANGMQMMDYVLSEANKKNIKIIYTLTNNWKEFGGMLQYVMWNGGTEKDSFYTDPVIQGWYQDWISHVLNRVNSITGIRYKDDPAIFAWELGNEPRCQSDKTGNTMVNWVRDTSAFIKSLDSRHMVCVGDEGFLSYSYDESMAKFGTNHWAYAGGEGTDWNRFMALPDIDFGTVHLYPDHWSTTAEWGVSWIEHHAQENVYNKPWILEEYGYRDKATRQAVYASWFQAIMDNDVNGDNFWILSGVMEDGTSIYPDYDGFTIYYPSPDATLVSNHALEMNAKSVVIVPDTEPPLPPSGLQMEIYSSNRINLNWVDNSEIDLDNYNVYRSMTPNVQLTPQNFVAEVSSSEYSDVTVIPETTYYYVVTATDHSGNESPSSNEIFGTTPIPDIIPPSAPTGLIASAVSSSLINLDWTDNIETDLSGYKIYRSTIIGFTPSVSNEIATSVNSEYADSGLKDDTDYYYQVIAFDKSDNPSSPSTEVHTKTLKIVAKIRAQYYCGGTDASAVDIRPRIQLINDGPLDVSLSDISFKYWFTSEPAMYSLSTTIDYAAVGNGEITSSFGDNVDVQYMNGGFTPLANAPTWLGGSGTANEFPIGASTGDLHIRILSSESDFNQLNDYSYDSTISSYTDYSKVTVYYKNDLVWGTEPPLGNTSPPTVSAPSDISYKLGETGNSISWIATDDNPTTYSIAKSGSIIDSGTWISGTPISINVDTLAVGTTPYTITVTDADGLSDSDIVNVIVSDISTVPSIPSGLTATATGVSTINIDWANNPETDIVHYEVHRSISADFSPSASSLVTTVTTSEYADTGLTSATTYYYKVVAVNAAAGKSLASSQASATTDTPQDTIPPIAPTGLTATSTGSTSISLNWADNTENDLKEYKVYRSTTSGFTPGTSTLVATVITSAYADSGLTAATTYYYKVTAVDTSTNEGASSLQASATTDPEGPSDVITVPFIQNGVGDFTWKLATVPNYINCWNLQTLTINGVDYTNKYVSGSSLPPAVDGIYTIHYVGNYGWSHLEIN